MTVRCPCGSAVAYQTCCGMWIEGQLYPSSPEQLMRSRYTAYTLVNIDYIKRTMRGQAAEGFDEVSAAHWARGVRWVDLNVLNAPPAQATAGEVEYVARYIEQDVLACIHEISEFHVEGGRWFYTGGELITHPTQKLGRYEPCPCGSMKKYKFCHG
jgi:SEC-C motif-containing protein